MIKRKQTTAVHNLKKRKMYTIRDLTVIETLHSVIEYCDSCWEVGTGNHHDKLSRYDHIKPIIVQSTHFFRAQPTSQLSTFDYSRLGT